MAANNRENLDVLLYVIVLDLNDNIKIILLLCSLREVYMFLRKAFLGIWRLMVMLRLIEAHCVPILCYAIEMTDVAYRDERRSLRVAYNAIFRKLFGYRVFESVTNLQHALGRPTREELVKKRKSGFMTRARFCDDRSLIRALVT